MVGKKNQAESKGNLRETICNSYHRDTFPWHTQNFQKTRKTYEYRKIFSPSL